ncbi:hypothetical protein [Echinicola sp. 20G]|uniref:hypothetical protein n=1 Tax=Echinicola sp. 20G TaxID=2781961 RepID=UPI0019105356|nr:hypothetical protein [Echinicola sp. 20G]
MSWMDKDAGKLLQRSFVIGLVGILLCLIPMANAILTFMDQEKLFFLNGFGLGAQLVALSMAVLVLRKRKVDQEHQEKAKRMIITLGVSLLFFILNR